MQKQWVLFLYQPRSEFTVSLNLHTYTRMLDSISRSELISVSSIFSFLQHKQLILLCSLIFLLALMSKSSSKYICFRFIRILSISELQLPTDSKWVDTRHMSYIPLSECISLNNPNDTFVSFLVMLSSGLLECLFLLLHRYLHILLNLM